MAAEVTGVGEDSGTVQGEYPEAAVVPKVSALKPDGRIAQTEKDVKHCELVAQQVLWGPAQCESKSGSYPWELHRLPVALHSSASHCKVPSFGVPKNI